MPSQIDPLPLLALPPPSDPSMSSTAKDKSTRSFFMSQIVQEELPLTKEQQDRLGKRHGPSSISVSSVLPIKDDPWVLERTQFTWQALASHNPVLRTIIIQPKAGEQAHSQVILKHTLPVQDISPEGSEEFNKTGQLGFYGLARLFLEYADAIKPTVHILMDDVLVDEASLHLLQRDLLLFYGGYSFKPHPPFSHYADYVAHQDVAQAERFWSTYLHGLVEKPIAGLYSEVANAGENYLKALQRPTMIVSNCCESHARPGGSLNSSVVNEMRHAARRLDVSVETLIYGAWAVTLAWHVNTIDDLVDFAIAGRDLNYAGHGSLVGLADHTYPLKVKCVPTTPIGEWLRAIADGNREASSNAFIGSMRIHTQAPGFSTPSRITILGKDATGFCQPCIGRWKKSSTRPTFDLDIKIFLGDVLTVEICSDLLVSNSKAQTLADHFLAVIPQLSMDPATSIGQIDLISEEEKEFLMTQSQPLTAPAEGLVHFMFEKQASLTPQAHAVQFEKEKPMTYTQLNSLSNAIARQLLSSRGAFIPVCMQRSSNLIIALLAILKSGSAYVLMDPEVPSERNLFITEDVAAPFVLTDQESRGVFLSEIIIEDLIGKANEEETSNLSITQSPQDIVYVIYTSGSTGHPKGVLLEHRAAYSGLIAFPILPGLRQLLFHNPIFSAAQRSIWSTLSQGGCLCLASKRNLTVNIGETINQMQVNTIDVTPSTASLIIPGSVPCLRRMTVAGELINPALLPLWVDRLEILNAYGLSENTQFNWRHHMRKYQNPQNIGRPIDTTSSYVLVPGSTKLSPLLVPGELCLGGHQLARGYLNRPEKTSEAFIKNPFGPGRLYRTGDMVIPHEDGSIEMVGRIDWQTKINDQRVEPGESNSIIQLHPQVNASVVVAASVLGKKSLVAFVIPKECSDWTLFVDELRRHLRKQLPLYMCPSFWLEETALPLNVNGKVDIPVLRQRAEMLSKHSLLQATRPAAVREEKLSLDESTIRNLWADALNLPNTDISRTDSFLSLGASSMDAITVSARARALDLNIELSTLLANLTLLEVAQRPDLHDYHQPNSIEPAPFSLAPTNFRTDDSNVEDVYPTTALQEGMLADSILGRANYFYVRAYRYHSVSLADLKRSVNAAIRHSKMLRTTFVAHGRSFLQVVQRVIETPWVEKEMTLNAFLHRQQTSEKNIELGGPFLRFFALQDNVLVVIQHHCLFDNWSSNFLVEDICSDIRRETLLPRPPFSRYIQYVQGRDHQVTRSFWQTYLQGANVTNLGSDVGKGFYLEETLTADIKSFCTKQQLPVGSLIYAMWAVVLSLQIGSNDVLFGTALSGRDTPVSDILTMSGPTLATAPLRIQLDNRQSLLEVVQNVQSQVWSVASYAYYGIHNILRSSSLPSNSFDSMVNCLVSGTIEDRSAPLRPLDLNRPSSNNYVTLELVENDSRRVKLMSNCRLDCAAELLGRLVKVLTLTTQIPTMKLDEAFSCLGSNGGLKRLQKDQELRRMSLQLVRKNEPFPPKQIQSELLHYRFEQRTQDNPSAIAVQWELKEKISYQSLNNRAARLAKYLNDSGIGPGHIVPLLLEKSAYTVIAILGVLKSGAAYLPLSPDSPADRNRFIIAEVRAREIISHTALKRVLSGFDITPLFIDQMDERKLSDTTLDVEVNGTDLAYVIYTSGSTGLPKGVKISHSSASTAVENMLKVEGRMKGDWRSLQFANYVFDASIQDIFNTLSSGGTLCLAPVERMLSDLPGIIREMNVKQLILTPTVARLISPGEAPSIEKLIIGGEQMTLDVVEKWSRNCELLNVYGPSETSMVATAKPVTPGTNPKVIGKPLASIVAAVIEPEGSEIMPYGEVGELCIGGPQVFDGYVNRNDLTEKSLVLVESVHERPMYRTGDLARWLPDEELECLGRKDNQIKIAGHRIELGEIEQAMLRTKLIQDCAVLMLDHLEQADIVCFCVFETSPRKHIMSVEPFLNRLKELRSSLGTLAGYMLPKYIFPMGELPRLLSQKIDRVSLKSMGESFGRGQLIPYSFEALDLGENTYVDVQSEKEALLQFLFSDIFQVPSSQLGATANFYRIGGDSISAINLVSRCRSENYSLSVNNVLKNPIIRELALFMVKDEQSLETVVPRLFSLPCDLYSSLKDSGVTEDQIDYAFPCPPGQAEFLSQGERNDQYWTLMTRRLLSPSEDIGSWIEHVATLTQQNAILRSTYSRDSNHNWIGVVLKDPKLSLSIHECSPEDGNAIVDRLWQSRFSFGRPYVQYLILKYSHGRNELVVKIDHGLWDGTLLRIFDDQFSSIQRRAPVLPNTDFKAFAFHLWHTDKTESLRFWEKTIHRSQTNFNFFKHEADSAFKVTRSFVASAKIAVEKLASRCNVTASVVFQSAFQLYLAQQTQDPGCSIVTFDYLLTGRNVAMADPQSINGNCANFLPFRADIDAGITLKSYLVDTQTFFWTATDHGDVGLDDIYSHSGLARSEVGNKCLFLFQPFEPASAAASAGMVDSEMRFVTLALSSEVRMYQPYALVVEWRKAVEGYSLKVMYDERVLTQGGAEDIAREQINILERMIWLDVEATLGQLL